MCDSVSYQCPVWHLLCDYFCYTSCFRGYRLETRLWDCVASLFNRVLVGIRCLQSIQKPAKLTCDVTKGVNVFILAVIVLLTVGFLAGGKVEKLKIAHLQRENEMLKGALESQEENTKQVFEWISDQLYHRDMMNVSISNMREVAVRFEDGAISADDAHMQYEMLRAEGQVHFDALDPELRDWYERRIREYGDGFIFGGDEGE